jgi:PEGA domain-containing protein
MTDLSSRMGGRAWLIGALVAQLAAAPGLARAGGASGPGDADASRDAAAVSEGPEQALTQKIAVLSLDALGMAPEPVARLENLFRMELDRLASSPLPTRRDIDRAVRGRKDLRDCSGDDKCLAAIGKQLGVEIVVSGSVAALGDSYIVNIKAVDVATAKQIRRIASDPLRGSPDELIEAVRVAAYRLLAPDQLQGSITVLTDLVGASVAIDGKEVGKTPLPRPIGKLGLGPHQLRVAAAGYVPFAETVDVRFQKSTRVVVRLAAEQPAGGGATAIGSTTRRVKRAAETPWYGSTWFYLGVGALAIGAGALAGYELGKDDVIDCSAEPGRCQ